MTTYGVSQQMTLASADASSSSGRLENLSRRRLGFPTSSHRETVLYIVHTVKQCEH